MSKFLYLFLRDAYGGYKNTDRNRIIDIQKLKHMMNIHNCNMSNTDFVIELRKSIKEISKYSDLTIQKMTAIKKRDFKSGANEIIEINFEMMKDTDKIYSIKSKKCKSKDAEESTESTDTSIKENTTEPNNSVDDANTNTESVIQSFDEFVEELVEVEYQRHLSYGTKVNNTKAYKNKIRKSFLDGGEIKSQFELVSYLEEMKSELKEKITDNQPYMIVFKDNSDNPYHNLSFNNDYKLVNSFGDIVTDTIDETIDYIDNRVGSSSNFEIERCMDIKNMK